MPAASRACCNCSCQSGRPSVEAYAEAISESRVLAHSTPQVRDTDPVGGPGQENNSLMRGQVSTDQERSADHAMMAYDCGLENASKPLRL